MSTEAGLLTTEIITKGLSVNYGDVTALAPADFTAKGRIISLIGHNGSGKSTLIKTILELLTPRTGTLEVYQTDASGVRTRLIPEEHMAFSPETGAVFADMSVEDYVKLWCRIKHRDGSYYKRDPRRYVERLELGPLMKKLGRELSKGQRRRVQTAVGFLSAPKFFLFDEPFDGLDIQQSNTLAELMREESTQMSLLISSHRMELVERLSDLVVVLGRGQLLACGGLEAVCSTLCRQSVMISNSEPTGSHFDSLMPEMRELYKSCLVNRIGGQLLLSGNNIDIEAVSGYLEGKALGKFTLELVRPTLIDAMNYHIHKVA